MKYMALLVLPVIAGCASLDLESREGQCAAAQTALLIAQSEEASEDTLRRLELAAMIACGVEPPPARPA